MAQQKRNRKVLLIEPNYANKFPPIGLMKISTYYKMLGDEVVFYKGDLRQFVIERIADKCIVAFAQIDSSIDWRIKREFFIEYIRTKRKEHANQLDIEESEMSLLLWAKLIDGLADCILIFYYSNAAVKSPYVHILEFFQSIFLGMELCSEVHASTSNYCQIALQSCFTNLTSNQKSIKFVISLYLSLPILGSSNS